MTTPQARQRNDAELIQANRTFYDSLWGASHLIEPHRFNTWPLVSALAKTAPRRLEVAPGLRPRLPLQQTQFIDLSTSAVRCFQSVGASAMVGSIHALPFAEASFDLVCSFDIVEHVDDDEAAFVELARVCRPGGALLVSVPLHESAWTAFDDFVGHRRRYEPDDLEDKLRRHGFTIERSAVFGMQPKSSRLLDLGLWFLVHQRRRAMWWYNHVFMPIGLRTQKPLLWKPGLADDPGVDAVLLLCRRQA